MSSGIRNQGTRGLSATGAVKTLRTCAVPGSMETPLRPTITGINRTTRSVTTRATIPAALFAIVPNAVQAIAHVCRAWVTKPNCGCASAFTVTGSNAAIGEHEHRRSEAEPEESIRKYRAFHADQNGIHLARRQGVRHEDKDIEAACRVQQFAERRHLQNVGSHRASDGCNEEKHSRQIAEDASAFQHCERELES